MRRELFRHKLAYLILIIGLMLLTILFLAAWPNPWLQRIVVVAMSAFYVLWGVVTHLHADKITRRIVYEYLSMGVLAGMILFLVTL